MCSITPGEDIIDSRDVLGRIRQLRHAYDCAVCGELLSRGAPGDLDWRDAAGRVTCGGDADGIGKGDPHEVADESDAEELELLEALAKEGERHPDWQDGVTLIADDYFEDYARELAEDIGVIGSGMQWPLKHIDWTAAVDELKWDYMQVDFGGETYWMRS
jgi:hypothetical protein